MVQASGPQATSTSYKASMVCLCSCVSTMRRTQKHCFIGQCPFMHADLNEGRATRGNDTRTDKERSPKEAFLHESGEGTLWQRLMQLALESGQVLSDDGLFSDDPPSAAFQSCSFL